MPGAQETLDGSCPGSPVVQGLPREGPEGLERAAHGWGVPEVGSPPGEAVRGP